MVLPYVKPQVPARTPSHRRNHLTRTPPQVPQPSNVLGVFGLSIRTQDRDLHDYFGANGRRVEKALVVYDQRVRASFSAGLDLAHQSWLTSLCLLQSGRSRGFGFVTMGSVEEAEAAIAELNGIVSVSLSLSLALAQIHRKNC